MVKAIIFDCFGVLVSDGWLPFKHRTFDSNQEKYVQATILNRQVDSGQISYSQFLASLGELAGLPPEEVQRQIEGNVPNAELFELIESELKPVYKLGILSNAGGDWLEHLLGHQRRALFDAIALSYETRVIKPNALAFEIIATRLGVDPEGCLFIDDQPGYCDAARAAGMLAIPFTDVLTLRRNLVGILRRP